VVHGLCHSLCAQRMARPAQASRLTNSNKRALLATTAARRPMPWALTVSCRRYGNLENRIPGGRAWMLLSDPTNHTYASGLGIQRMATGALRGDRIPACASSQDSQITSSYRSLSAGGLDTASVNIVTEEALFSALSFSRKCVGRLPYANVSLRCTSACSTSSNRCPNPRPHHMLPEALQTHRSDNALRNSLHLTGTLSCWHPQLLRCYADM
jgi:hypothetical protein